MKLFDLHDIKALGATIAGIGNWMLEIDAILKVALTAASLVYVVITCKVKWQEYKNKQGK